MPLKHVTHDPVVIHPPAEAARLPKASTVQSILAYSASLQPLKASGQLWVLDQN